MATDSIDSIGSHMHPLEQIFSCISVLFFSQNSYEPCEIDSSGISNCSDVTLTADEMFPILCFFQKHS